MTESPFWFGPADRPLFGWWHAPDDGLASGGVVLCPPLGQEYMGTHRTFRLLASRLAEAGLVAVRIDYDGTGDSAGGMVDQYRVTAWTASVVAAIEQLRASGLARVGLVGMRIGATLAAAAAAEVGGVDQLVLWDPSRSGRVFLREQQALGALSHQLADTPADLPPGWVEVPAWVYTDETVADFRTLDIGLSEGPLAERALVLSRPDRPIDTRLRERLDSTDTTWLEAKDQPALIDAIPSQNLVPEVTIDAVVGWLTAASSDSGSVVPPPITSAVVVARNSRGAPITESAVTFGSNRLFGIVTEPAERRGPTVIFLDVAAEHHVGPARLWVELARRWAAEGVRSVRFDFGGLGDSPSRPGQHDQVMYGAGDVDEVIEVATALAPDDPSQIVLIGLCSGAYAAMDAALQLLPRGVCLVNPVMSFRPRPFAAGPTPERPVVHGLRRRISPDLYARLSRLRFLAREAWSVALDELHVVTLPRTVINRLVSRGVKVLLIAGAQQLAVTSAAPRRGLLPDPHPQLRIVSPADLDHSLLADGPRQHVVKLLTDQMSSFLPASSD